MTRPVPIDDLVEESERLRRILLAESRKLNRFAELLIEQTRVEGTDDDVRKGVPGQE